MEIYYISIVLPIYSDIGEIAARKTAMHNMFSKQVLYKTLKNPAIENIFKTYHFNSRGNN